MVNTYFVGVIEALAECRAPSLSKLLPIWRPVMNNYKTKVIFIFHVLQFQVSRFFKKFSLFVHENKMYYLFARWQVFYKLKLMHACDTLNGSLFHISLVIDLYVRRFAVNFSCDSKIVKITHHLLVSQSLAATSIIQFS